VDRRGAKCAMGQGARSAKPFAGRDFPDIRFAVLAAPPPPGVWDKGEAAPARAGWRGAGGLLRPLAGAKAGNAAGEFVLFFGTPPGYPAGISGNRIHPVGRGSRTDMRRGNSHAASIACRASAGVVDILRSFGKVSANGL
jgi:hypothetical protein